jgi:hypothetical protein
MLAYIIYYDTKGKLRKETSWESWRDKKIDSNEFINEPTEGFVVNKNVGGVSSGYHSWDTRMEKIRIYDPRGFEFEITLPNLLYILENATSTKGKGLEGKFIYGWDAKDLVLIPEDSPEYKEMMQYSSLQSQKVAKKDLILGGIYLDNTGKKITYLQEANQYDMYGENPAKKLWFSYNDESVNTWEIKNVKAYTGEVNSEYANLISLLDKNSYYNPKLASKKSYQEVYRLATLVDTKQSGYSYATLYSKITFKNGNDKYKRVYINKEKVLKEGAIPTIKKTVYNGKENIQEVYDYNKDYQEVYFIGDSTKYSTIDELLLNHPLYVRETIDLRTWRYEVVTECPKDRYNWDFYIFQDNNYVKMYLQNTTLTENIDGVIHYTTVYFIDKDYNAWAGKDKTTFTSIEELFNNYTFYKKIQN